MNRVGAGGQGESVWLGWFLHATLSTFAPLAEARGEFVRAAAWRQHADRSGVRARARSVGRRLVPAWLLRRRDAARLREQLRMPDRLDRAVVGRDLRCRGSCTREAVDGLRGRAPRPPRRRADPAIHATLRPVAVRPGLHQGLPAGIRENGGQYTHAAAWSVIAFAMLGDGDRAAELFTMLNPIHHAGTRTEVHRYKVEPYVACADVYAEPPHVGRGGWTWYTARRAGCTAPGWSGSSAFACGARPSGSTRACRWHGTGSRSSIAITALAITSSSRTRSTRVEAS